MSSSTATRGSDALEQLAKRLKVLAARQELEAKFLAIVLKINGGKTTIRKYGITIDAYEQLLDFFRDANDDDLLWIVAKLRE